MFLSRQIVAKFEPQVRAALVKLGPDAVLEAIVVQLRERMVYTGDTEIYRILPEELRAQIEAAHPKPTPKPRPEDEIPRTLDVEIAGYDVRCSTQGRFHTETYTFDPKDGWDNSLSAMEKCEDYKLRLEVSQDGECVVKILIKATFEPDVADSDELKMEPQRIDVRVTWSKAPALHPLVAEKLPLLLRAANLPEDIFDAVYDINLQEEGEHYFSDPEMIVRVVFPTLKRKRDEIEDDTEAPEPKRQ